jgi:predicted metal-dependent phosphoesterase TrpH
MSLYLGWGALPAFVSNLKKEGLDGIEAWHPQTTAGICRRLCALGAELSLLITAGSDFHGRNRANRRLGFTAGGKKIDGSLQLDAGLRESGLLT